MISLKAKIISIKCRNQNSTNSEQYPFRKIALIMIHLVNTNIVTMQICKFTVNSKGDEPFVNSISSKKVPSCEQSQRKVKQTYLSDPEHFRFCYFNARRESNG